MTIWDADNAFETARLSNITLINQQVGWAHGGVVRFLMNAQGVAGPEAHKAWELATPRAFFMRWATPPWVQLQFDNTSQIGNMEKR